MGNAVGCTGESSHRFEQITLRRAQVLRELARGCTHAEVADQLGLTVDTVRSHVETLKTITDCETTRDLAQWWRAEGRCWIDFLAREAGFP